MIDQTEMPFLDHLEELRWCLIKSLMAIILGSIITYNYCEIILYWLITPSKSLPIDVNLQVLKVTSMLSIKLIVTLFGGIIIGLPVIIYQFLKFILPAFKNDYTVSIFFAILFSTLFFISGMIFAYFIIIPFSLYFFTSLTFEKIVIEYNFNLASYLIYVLWLIFAYKKRFTSRGIINAFVFINLIIWPVGLINYLLDANYMFVCKAPNVDNALLIGEWPIYLIWLELIGFIYIVGLWMPFKFASYMKK